MACEVACAAIGGVVSRFMTHPLDTCKSVALTAEGAGNQSTFRAAWRSVMQREGLKGFYRGAGIAVVGSAPGVALYLTSYSYFKDKLQPAAAVVGNAPIHLSCGFLAEAISCVFWVPIDVIKERLQVQTPNVPGRYTSSMNGIRVCLAHEGVWGLYKGYTTTVSSFGPYSAIYFCAYEYILTALFGQGDKRGALGAASEWSAASQGLIAGGAANVVACLTTNPLEVVKTRVQVQRARLLQPGGGIETSAQFSYAYNGLAHGLVTLARTEGVAGLFRGVGARTLYAVPNSALGLCFYTGLRSKLCGVENATL
jgi:hypothetical protein